MSSFNLYPRNSSAKLDLELFRNPTREYRGTPFWSWNTKLDKNQLLRQMELLKQMGMGGVHIHARTGLATEYLGAEFMDCVKACVEKARATDMLVWLYDEDRWPSGFAGGLVTKDVQHRLKYIVFTPYSYEEKPADDVKHIRKMSDRSGNGVPLGRYQIIPRTATWPAIGA